MEFTDQQMAQLKQIKQIINVNKLQFICERIKSDMEYVQTERREYLEKQEQLKKRLADVEENMKNKLELELKLQHKLDLVKKSPIEYNDDFLQNICILLGYQISKCHLLEQSGVRKKLLYGSDCNVTINELNQLYDLVEVYPQHPEFTAIRQFLQNSQDLKGILTCLKMFFDTKQKRDSEN